MVDTQLFYDVLNGLPGNERLVSRPNNHVFVSSFGPDVFHQNKSNAGVLPNHEPSQASF
jgi:hypothetical protein